MGNASSFRHDISQVAAHLNLPEVQVRALLTYAAVYPDEIQAASDDHDAAEAALPALIPNLEIVRA